MRCGRITVTALALSAAAALTAGCGGAGSPQDPAASTTAPAPARSPEPRPTRLTIAVSGDLLIHAPIWQRALQLGGGSRYDFAPLLRPLRRYVAGADLAFCHVETPLTPAPPSGYPIFNAPPALARAIRATGWDACDTASNHTLDMGQAGIAATGAALDRAGVRHTGSFAAPQGPRRTLMLTARGVRVALLAYTTTTNGLSLPHPWSVNLADADRIVRDARRARRRGAQVVVVNLHWGDEYGAQPSAAQRQLADRLTRVPAITGSSASTRTWCSRSAA